MIYFLSSSKGATWLQTYRKIKNQFLIKNVSPREMHLSLITVCNTLIRVTNLLKKAIRNGFANLYRKALLRKKCLKSNF
jgi:hypothetical protein